MPTPPSHLVDDAIVKPCDVLGGKYRVERVVGMGGMGIVVAVRHIDLRTRFALKLMRPEAARDPDAVERFLREARAAVQLKSEHCAHVVDVGRLDSGSPYMVMEFLEGRDLGDVVAHEGARSPAEAVDYILQACEGIAEAHAHGIIHRDIKPQNLFVTRRPDGSALVKVLDFGLAKSILATKEARVLTQTTAVMGSPVYMSPEQMRASRTVDVRSDTWSLGVCLYELLTGRPPFEGSTFPELCSMVLNEPPAPMPSDVPRGLSKIIWRCLEKNPMKRFESVGALGEALEEFAPQKGAAARIAAILATRHKPLPSLPPEATSSDPNAETRSATSMDTLRRAHLPNRRRPIAAGVLAACAVFGIAAIATRVSRSTPASPAPPIVATPPTLPPIPTPASTSTSTSTSTPTPTPTSTSTPTPTPPATASPPPPRRSPIPHHSSTPSAPAPPPASASPLLKPKTTDF